MPRPPPPPALPSLAYLLDFDGTLVEFASRPDAVHVDPELHQLLATVRALTGDAAALVSGRSVADLDRLFGDNALALAGLHGLQLRLGGGRWVDDVPPLPLALVEAARAAEARWPGLWVEFKGAAVALHYRRALHHADAAERVAKDLAARHPEVMIQRGHCVVELRRKGRDKGAAVRLLMERPPFALRVPVFVGDDNTDESGFLAAQELGGFGIKVGDGQTLAEYGLPDVASVRAWLASVGQAAARQQGTA